MKKSAIILALALISATPALSCTNGYEFHGSHSGTYCISDIEMNWWSAFAWCQAQGYRLATFEEACPDATSLVVDNGNVYVSNNVGTEASNKRVDNRYPWLARAWLTDKALYFGGWSCGIPCKGTIKSAARTAKHPALCIEQTFPKNYVIMGTC